MKIIDINTDLGRVRLKLLGEAAPITVAHISKLIADGLYNGCCFYRSDFVIQCGLQRADGTGVPNPHPDLKVNETKLTNKRGTVAVAHWDVPDCGNSVRQNLCYFILSCCVYITIFIKSISPPRTHTHTSCQIMVSAGYIGSDFDLIPHCDFVGILYQPERQLSFGCCVWWILCLCRGC